MTAPLATRLRRALGIEALVGIVVLALTSWLLALTPPGLGASGSRLARTRAAHRFNNTTLPASTSASPSASGSAPTTYASKSSAPATGLAGLTVEFMPPVNTFVTA